MHYLPKGHIGHYYNEIGLKIRFKLYADITGFKICFSNGLHHVSSRLARDSHNK